MKPYSILVAIALTVSWGASRALGQHGHGIGHMATHADLDHGSNMDHDLNTNHDSNLGLKAGHIPLTPATQLAHNPVLAARLQPLLPVGTTLQADAAGFKNLGQFIAALHVSHNLGIPFSQLKAEMTESKPDSLGQAIQDLRPTLSRKTVKSDVKVADQQARQDLKATEQPLTPAMRLAQNPALEARLQPLLPAGTTLRGNVSGFKSLGQFIAALHVSHNLGIPFSQLKAEMTESKPDSLGQAIQDLRPSLSNSTVRSNVKLAERQARGDLEATEQPGGDDEAFAERKDR
jgi:hypothetical protein